MAWITITEADVLTALSEPELTAFRGKGLAEGQPDTLEPVIAQVANEIRGRVAACGRHRLGAGTTIPEELLGVALDLVVQQLADRLGVPARGNRKDAVARAHETLTAVARCEFDFAAPETPDSERRAGPVPRIHANEPQYQRQHQEGT